MMIQWQWQSGKKRLKHVRRRVIEWKCETKRVGDFEVVQTLSELNSTSRLRPVFSPHRLFWRQPSKSGDAWKHYSWANQLRPVNDILVIFTRCMCIHALLEASPSSCPCSIPMLKNIDIENRH
jgi:hypothetical protein